MKKIIVLIVISMLLVGCSGNSSADSDSNYMKEFEKESSLPKEEKKVIEIPDEIPINEASDFSYEINNDQVTITGLLNQTLQFVGIPDTIEGYPVTSIGEKAFDSLDELYAVSMPDTVTFIEMFGFYACDNLIRIDFSENLENFGIFAISACQSLKSITLPNSLSNICNNSLGSWISEIKVQEDNPHFTTVDGVLFSKDMTTLVLYPSAKTGELYEVPNTVKTINSYAFDENDYLEEIILPEGLETILFCAINYCQKLTTLIIPASVTNIESNAFSFNMNLQEIKVHKDNLNYVSIDGVLFDKNVSSLLKYPNNKNEETYSVPDTVKVIEESAFYNLQKTEQIILPEGLEILAYQSFGFNRGTKIYIPESVTEFSYVFNDSRSIEIITPKGSAAEKYAIDNNMNYSNK